MTYSAAVARFYSAVIARVYSTIVAMAKCAVVWLRSRLKLLKINQEITKDRSICIAKCPLQNGENVT
jgi:hypothetical protein